MSFAYPISLELTGRRCVVVGGGEVGEHKIKGLVDAGARVVVISAQVTEGISEAADRGEVELVSRGYRPGDLDGAFLAIAATDDPAVNAAVFDEGEERAVLVNSVDDIEHCHFAAPALVRRGDLTLAISTGGKAPALAKRLRLELSEKLGPEYGELVDVLGRARSSALPRRVGFDEWAGRWAHALDEDLLALVTSGRQAEAERIVSDALRGNGYSNGASGAIGKVWIVGAGPGDPGLLTVKGRRVLDAADVVVHDHLVNAELLRGKDALSVGKRAGHQSTSQEEINRLLIDLARRGKKVVRLKGGDPFVFGRGAEEAKALRDAGIDFEIVSAPSSAIAGLASAGIPVTDRRAASSVAFVTGHCAGDKAVNWRALARAADTIVVLMGLARLREIAAELVAGGLDPKTPAAVVQDATLPSQRVVAASLAELPGAVAAAGIGPPALIVVGEVVALRDVIAGRAETVGASL